MVQDSKFLKSKEKFLNMYESYLDEKSKILNERKKNIDDSVIIFRKLLTKIDKATSEDK